MFKSYAGEFRMKYNVIYNLWLGNEDKINYNTTTYKIMKPL